MSSAPEPQAQQAFRDEIGRLREMAGEWSGLFPQAAAQGQHWQKVLAQVESHVAEDTCRLAAVGAVKSGKSTMINALLGQDLLKRGAGILTAMITRVQPGPEPQAVLQFKGWDEINGEIRRALGLLPNPRLADRGTPLDLKEAPDRELLAQVLAEAQEADLWTGGSLDQNYLLLKSYLEGYDLLKDLMPATGVLPLAGADLARHRELVTREATAVYLKDVLLTIPFPWPAAGVELGDCQGSDSPFSQHLAQVLAYLIKSDLVLYVISSRVGLRQADFQFLTELKRMGLLPHILTLLNLDLGEHPSYAEVVKIRDRVAQELTSWLPHPRVYAFSALKLLLDRRQARGESLDSREAALLQVWAMDQESATFSEAEAGRFEADLKTALEDLRSRRLAGGSLAQVKMVARG
ncbi:MAG TPA: dynamin family protein, partial [Desulfobaccales bacterium]|nr:dynamin family protein [Desulfobaccales bacterium]